MVARPACGNAGRIACFSGAEPAYSSTGAAAAFFPEFPFLAAVFLRLASSAGSTFFSISLIDPPAFSIAALAEAVA